MSKRNTIGFKKIRERLGWMTVDVGGEGGGLRYARLGHRMRRRALWGSAATLRLCTGAGGGCGRGSKATAEDGDQANGWEEERRRVCRRREMRESRGGKCEKAGAGTAQNAMRF